jgi:uncharacterized membrane protein YidH (DUF202 family)
MSSAEESENAPRAKTYLEEAACAMVYYYAAERTLMAWVRVALGMMALGFVIDRFGLVLRMMPCQASMATHPTAYSFLTGTVLVLGGAVMAIVAAIRYNRPREVSGARAAALRAMGCRLACFSRCSWHLSAWRSESF